MDVSGYQSAGQVEAVAADPSMAFVIVKATQGLGYVSTGWPGHRDAAGAKYLGAYHYCEVDHDPIAEADHFLATAQPQSGHVITLDVERAVTPDFVLTWLDYVAGKTGATPLVYSNWKWIPPLRSNCTVEQWERLVAYPCFLAENDPPGKHEPIDPKPGSSKGWPVLVHQYVVEPYAGGDIDRDWTPDLTALKELGAK